MGKRLRDGMGRDRTGDREGKKGRATGRGQSLLSFGHPRRINMQIFLSCSKANRRVYVTKLCTDVCQVYKEPRMEHVP